MKIEDVLTHPFLRSGPGDVADNAQVQTVLSNIVRFSEAPRFFSLVMSSAARQLDHSNSGHMSEVFQLLDTNHDGVLDRQELRNAFNHIFGESSNEANQIQQVFHKLDLDGTGKLTYTEFCTAGMEEDVRMQEQVLWSAFKAFDDDNNGVISVAEIERHLAHADVNVSLSKEICENVARGVIEGYDSNGDGGIDFEEFKCMMQSCVKPHGMRQAKKVSLMMPSADIMAIKAPVLPGDPDPTPPRRRSWAARNIIGMIERAKNATPFHSSRRRVSVA
jgi:Ca2+-binding EF-hand superfamily protein